MEAETEKERTDGRRRPALYVLSGLGAGLVVSAVLEPPLVPVFILTAVTSAVAFYLYFRGSRFSVYAVVLALASAGCLYYSACSRYVGKNDVSLLLDGYRPTWAAVEGVIANDPEQRDGRMLFDLHAESVTPEGGERTEVTGKTRVTIYDNIPLRYGDRLRLTGNLARPKPPVYEAGFDYRRYLKTRGVTAALTVPSGKFVSVESRSATNPVYGFSYAVRRYAADGLDRYVGGEEGRLVKGMMLGTRGEIDPGIVSEFTDAGVVHILAISGQNVSLIAFVLFLLLSGANLSRRASAVVVAAFLPVYTIMTGLDPPVVRATVMALLVLGAVFIDKDVDLINVLAASAIFLLVYNPLLVEDASFQLSYAATFAIALFYKPFFRWFGFLPPLLRETAAATLAAQIGTLPLQLHLFYRLSPVAWVSNLLIVPASSLAIVFGLIALAAGVIHPILGELYGAAAWFVSKVIIVTAGACANGLEPLGRLWPVLAGWRPFVEYGDLQFWVGRPPLPAVLSIVAAILFFAFGAWKWRRVMLVSFVVLVALTVVGEVIELTGPSLRVTFLDVGNGDAALIEAPGGRRLLVDAGYGNEDYSAGRAKVEPFLHARGIDRLDVLCITSADPGAAGGAPYIIENVPLGELWAGRGWTGGGYYDPMPAVEDAAADVGVKRVNPGPDSVYFGDARLTTFEGDDSTSILLTYERFSLFYPGFRGPGQLRVLPGTDGPSGVTVLKAPARGTVVYGMGDSARILSPAVVVISAKRGGRPERPDPAEVGTFERIGSRVLVTADHGSVVVETDGVNVRIRTAF